MRSVLIVDSDVGVAAALAQRLEIHRPLDVRLDITVRSTFSAARAELRARPPSLLFTALQLHEYNGLHLVYLAKGIGLSTRSVVYAKVHDVAHAREVRLAGAFYDILPHAPVALPAYVKATLPLMDRRVGPKYERRIVPRGGRRAPDQYVAA